MRTRQRKLLTAASVGLVLLLLLAGIVYLASPHEPSYQGKSLSEWIAPFCVQTTTNLYLPVGPQYFQQLEPTRRAVREMGTNALPFLVAKLNRRESSLHRTLREISN